MNTTPFKISFELKDQGNVSLIPPSLIDPNPNNTRQKSRFLNLPELAESMKEFGQKEAARVYKDGDRYILISGERRWRSCILGGIPYLVCIIIPKPKNLRDEFREIALYNFGGEPLTHMEIAFEADRLQNDCLEEGLGLSAARKKIGKIMGRSDTSIVNHLELLKLPKDIQERLDPDTPKKKRLAFSKAVQLAKLPNKAEMIRTMRDIMETGMRVQHVRARVEKAAKEAGSPLPRQKRRPGDDYDVVKSSLRNFEQALDTFEVWGQEGFEDIFAHRKDDDVVKIDRRLKAIQDRIAKIRRMVVRSK